MKYLRTTLMLFIVTSFTSVATIGQSIELTQRNYFKERISNSNIENELIPFSGNTKLKKQDVAKSKEKVWSIWKSVNYEIEKLPEFSQSTASETPVHNWTLIDEDPMPFYLLRKGDEAGEQQKPLFLNLHGSGPKIHEFRATLNLSKAYVDAPSVYFIPQIPNERRYRWWFQPVQNAWERLFRLSMLNDEIDPNKIFVMGISEGGYGSQRLGAFYADYLAGVGPMAGEEPLKNAPPLNFRNVAFSFHTGEYDTMFGRNELTALASSVFDSLESKHPGDFVHNVVIQEGKGHAVDYTKTTPWLVKYERRISPETISWVYFPMHNRYRKGFYNVAITKFPGLKEEDVYNRILFNINFNKKNNTITIDAKLMNDEMTDLKDMQDMQDMQGGEIALYLDDRYIDYSKKVKVVYNDKTVYNSKLKLIEENIVESCGLFGDPERLFPTKITIPL